MKDSPSVPQAPDPNVVARAQTGINADTARMLAQMNRVNQNTPFGSISYQRGQNADGTPSDTWTSDVRFSPEQQALLSQQYQLLARQNQLSAGYGDAAMYQMNAVGNRLGQPLAGLPRGGEGMQGQINMNGVPPPRSFIDMSGMVAYDPQAESQFGMQNQINTAGVPQMGNPYGYAQDATQAILSRVNPELDRQRTALNTQLTNQGIPVGSEAWQTSQRQFGQQANDAVQQAVLQGYGLGSQQFQNTLAANQQGFGQQAQQAQFGNQAQAQSFGQSLQNAQLQNAVRQSQFGEGLNAAQLANQAQQMAFQQAQQRGQFANQAQAQEYGQNMNAAQYSDAQRMQALNELGLLRQNIQPSSVTAPTFPGVPQVSLNPANIEQAYQNQYQGGLNAYNTQVGAQNSFNSGLMQSAALAALYFSDRRLKSNIKRVGMHRLGIGIYEYDIFGRRERGVMADEVEKVLPQAVGECLGYKMVNYRML